MWDILNSGLEMVPPKLLNIKMNCNILDSSDLRFVRVCDSAEFKNKLMGVMVYF
jgi:hypothetical protein